MQKEMNFSLPKISVITAVYNGIDSLEPSINSVLNQTYNNIEFIIIDGGSTDGTVDIIKKYEDRIAFWVSEKDKGVYDAMNKGVERATGEWIYFLGSGDILLNVMDRISKLLIDSNKVYYGDVFRLDTQEKYDGEFSAYKLAITNICHQAIFYPVSVFIKHRYNLKYKIMADHILNMQCFGDKYQFTYFPFTIAIYEGDGYSANNIDQEYMKDKLHLVKENFPNSIYNYAVLRRKLSKLKKH